MNLFRHSEFKAHSGEILRWKINCDALVPADWRCLARIVTEIVGPFGAVEGVPRGGLWLATALWPWITKGPLLIVDDVLTTGASMEEQRADRSNTIGAVIFARGPCPSWVTPVFQMHHREY